MAPVSRRAHVCVCGSCLLSFILGPWLQHILHGLFACFCREGLSVGSAGFAATVDVVLGTTQAVCGSIGHCFLHARHPICTVEVS